MSLIQFPCQILDRFPSNSVPKLIRDHLIVHLWNRRRPLALNDYRFARVFFRPGGNGHANGGQWFIAERTKLEMGAQWDGETDAWLDGYNFDLSVLFAGISRMPRRRFVLLVTLSNIGISGLYATVGALALSLDSFLLAFVSALLLPAIAILGVKRAKS